MYSLPHAGKISNNCLVKVLVKHGYCPDPHTNGLFVHDTNSIQFSLVVDDFGIKYTDKKDAQHLVAALSAKYEITTNWTGDKFLGLELAWDYTNGTVNISMPGYIEKSLQRFAHPTPTGAQHSPHPWQKPNYGSSKQLTPPIDTSAPLDSKGISRLQEAIGTILYYI